MTAHELAAKLLAGPNLPVVINGWGCDEGITWEVTEVSPEGTCIFTGSSDDDKTPRDAMHWELPRACVSLWHGKSNA